MKKLILSSLLVLSTIAQADDIRLGEPGYAGTGCPAGSASVVLSPDAKELSILFDQYVAEAGRDVGKTIDRKSCNLAIPVHVPQGYSVSILEVDYRGFNAIPVGGRSVLSAEYFFAGSRGPKISRTFLGPLNEEYAVTDRLLATAVVWSRCGEDVNLRVNSSMTAQTNSRREQTLSTVDSIDVDARIVYRLQWRRCN